MVANRIGKYLLATVLIMLALLAGGALSYASNKNLGEKLFSAPLAEGQRNNPKNKAMIITTLLTIAVFGAHGIATGLINSANTEELYALSKIQGLDIAARYIGLIPPALGNAVFTYNMFLQSGREDYYAFFGKGKVWADPKQTLTELTTELLTLKPTPESESNIREKILTHLNNRLNRIEASNSFATSKEEAESTINKIKASDENLIPLFMLGLQDASAANFKSIKFAAFWLSSMLLGGFVGTFSNWFVKSLAPSACEKILLDFGIEKEQTKEVGEIAGMVALVCTAFMTMLALKTSFFKKIFRHRGLQDILKPKASWLLNLPALGLAATTIVMTLRSSKGVSMEWLAMLLATSILGQTVLSRLGLDTVLSDYNLKKADPRDQLSLGANNLYQFLSKLDTFLLICYYTILTATESALKNPNIPITPQDAIFNIPSCGGL